MNGDGYGCHYNNIRFCIVLYFMGEWWWLCVSGSGSV